MVSGTEALFRENETVFDTSEENHLKDSISLINIHDS